MAERPTKLPYSKHVANYVRQAVQDGVQIKDIIATVNKKYQNAPRTSATFYKLYGADIAEARLKLQVRLAMLLSIKP
jgi:hypothetical protein